MALKNEKRWIGIDGGGTKTHCVIGDEEGHILSQAIGASSNIQTIPHQEVFTTLSHLIETVLEASKSNFQEIECIQLCLAGADRERDKVIIKGLFEDTIYENKIMIKNDAQAALASGTWGEPGLLLIAGTGSIVYGIFGDSGTSFRVGGWGYLLGDEGSGFYMGQKALRAVLQSHDGRGANTALAPLILKHFQIEQASELIKLYSSERIVPMIANVSKFVFEAAKQADAIALEILEDAVKELVGMVEVAINKHFQCKDNMLVLHGGLFSDQYFKNLFITKISSEYEDLKIVQPEIPAVVGAYLLAIIESGLVIDEKMKHTIRRSWNELND